jgi:hypothetical protein
MVRLGTSKKSFLASSGLKKGDMEICEVNKNPNLLSIFYRHPITHDRMTTPNGSVFKRFRLLSPEHDDNGKPIKYRTCKNGGLHLYFPDSRKKGNVVDSLKANPNSPVYITEGEKKAAKAWKEGLPCVGLSGIWCWLANKQDRPNKEKVLHPDFNLLPDLKNRSVFMIYDSDAHDPNKSKNFQKCSKAFERCLRGQGITRYEMIVLPSDNSNKVGLDDYLLEHSVKDLKELIAQQSKVAPIDKFILTSNEFLSTNFPPISSIVEPWLNDCGLTMIHASPGVGKTYFLLGLSAAITRKKLPVDFCGWHIKKGASVLFVDGEMPSCAMQSRLAKVEAAHPNNPASKRNPLTLFSSMHYIRQTDKMINFSNAECRSEFSKYLRNHPAKIIILDNIVSLMTTKDENDAGAWSVINQWLLSLRGMGKSVIIVHHSSKHGTQRGTSHRTDNLDTIIKLSKTDGGIKAVFEKHRNFGGDEASSVYIDFNIDDTMAVFTKSENDDVDIAKRDRLIFKMSKKGRSQEYIIKKIKAKFGQELSKGRISQIVKRMKVEEVK